MFERYTRPALEALFFARYEVSQFGSSTIEPEHILLGMLGEGKGFGSRILTRSGTTLDELRSDILGRLAWREKFPASVEIPFSDSCQRVLLHATEEADQMLHNAIGTEHLLLGLLREAEGVAADVLAARGLTVDAVRETIVELLGSGEKPEPPGDPPTSEDP